MGSHPVIRLKEETLRPSGEEEYQRFMGFPASLVRWKADRPEGSQAVGGRNYVALLHPIAWLRWRIALERRGPYAPDFGEFRRKRRHDEKAEQSAESVRVVHGRPLT